MEKEVCQNGKFKKAKRTSRTVKTGKMKGWNVEITGTSYDKKSNPHPNKKSVINISELIINSSQDIKLKLKSYTLDELFQLTHDIDTELLAMYRNNQQNNYDKTIELLKKRRKIVESLVQQQLK